MVDTLKPFPIITKAEAVRFLESACRNWRQLPPLSQDDLADVADALTHFISARRPESAAIAAMPGQRERAAIVAMGDGWLPIESAPRDGTWFLAWEPNSDCPAYYACAFFGEEDGQVLWQASCGQYVTSQPEPEFWRLLPPAPETQHG